MLCLADEQLRSRDSPKLVYTNHVFDGIIAAVPTGLGGWPRLTMGKKHEIAGYPLAQRNGLWRFGQWIVHRDARWYEAPESFRPETVGGRRFAKAIATICVFSVWRRTAAVHWKYLWR